MKIDLHKLAKQDWIVKSDPDAGEIELMPPAMSQRQHEEVKEIIEHYVSTPMGADIVMGAFYDALGKAALLEAMK